MPQPTNIFHFLYNIYCYLKLLMLLSVPYSHRLTFGYLFHHNSQHLARCLIYSMCSVKVDAVHRKCTITCWVKDTVFIMVRFILQCLWRQAAGIEKLLPRQEKTQGWDIKAIFNYLRTVLWNKSRFMHSFFHSTILCCCLFFCCV